MEKCIYSKYGDICKKGLIFGEISQEDEKNYRFKASDIRKMLRMYRKTPIGEFYNYGTIRPKGYKFAKFPIWFNDRGAGIIIGCKRYNEETVKRAIRAFL